MWPFPDQRDMTFYWDLISTYKITPGVINAQEFDVEEWYYEARKRVYGIIMWHTEYMASSWNAHTTNLRMLQQSHHTTTHIYH